VPDPDQRDNPPDDGSIGQLVQLVKDYARQETLGPLRGAGRWIGVGLAGATLIAVGSAFVVLGVLRFLQTEVDFFDTKGWSILPYVIALVVCVLVAVIALMRVRVTTLQKERKS
jgi:uncharacterized membrane protein